MGLFGLFEGGSKFKIVSFGLALGVTWALGAFCLSLMSMFWDWGTPIVTLIGSGYVGYEATWAGAVTGAVWGFVDAFVGGVVFAWLYNKFSGTVKE